MDNTYCCVPQCKSRGNAFPRTSFHHFPSSIHLRNQWILKLKIGKEVSNRMVVCGKHFQRSDYFPGDNRTTWRVKRNAIPSQNLPVGWAHSENEDIFKKEKNVKLQRKRKNFPSDSFKLQEPGSNKETQQKKKLNHKPKEIADHKSKPVFVKILDKDDPSMHPEVQNLLGAPNNSEIFNAYEMKKNTFNMMYSEIIQTPKEDSETETSSESEREMNKILENESLKNSSSRINKSSVKLSKEEILQKKLKTMTERYKKTRKKMELYRHQWKLCVKQVDCLKTVIYNLKEINSVREDS